MSCPVIRLAGIYSARVGSLIRSGINFDAQQKPDRRWNVPRGEVFRALQLIDAHNLLSANTLAKHTLIEQPAGIFGKE